MSFYKWQSVYLTKEQSSLIVMIHPTSIRMPFFILYVTLVFTVQYTLGNEDVVSKVDLVSSRKNNISVGIVASPFGGYISLQYERTLIDFISFEAGVSPKYFYNFGLIYPIGLNIMLPLTKKHQLGVTAKLLYYSGGGLSSEEYESKSIITTLVRNKPTPSDSYMAFYRFKSEYYVTYSVGVGIVGGFGTYHPSIEIRTGYIF